MISIAFVQVIANQHNMFLKLLLPGELPEILAILLKVTARKINYWTMSRKKLQNLMECVSVLKKKKCELRN